MTSTIRHRRAAEEREGKEREKKAFFSCSMAKENMYVRRTDDLFYPSLTYMTDSDDFPRLSACVLSLHCSEGNSRSFGKPLCAISNDFSRQKLASTW